MCTISERFRRLLALMAFVTAVVGSTVHGQVYMGNQYGFSPVPQPVSPNGSLCPYCYPFCTCPPVSVASLPPNSGVAPLSDTLYPYQSYPSQRGFPLFIPDYRLADSSVSGPPSSESAARPPAESTARPSSESDTSQEATAEGTSRADTASPQRDLTSVPGFGNIAQSGATGATGSAVPNMIGDSTSIPTRLLAYNYVTWQYTGQHATGLKNWTSREAWYDQALNDGWFMKNTGYNRDDYLREKHLNFNDLCTRIENDPHFPITSIYEGMSNLSNQLAGALISEADLKTWVANNTPFGEDLSQFTAFLKEQEIFSSQADTMMALNPDMAPNRTDFERLQDLLAGQGYVYVQPKIEKVTFPTETKKITIPAKYEQYEVTLADIVAARYDPQNQTFWVNSINAAIPATDIEKVLPTGVSSECLIVGRFQPAEPLGKQSVTLRIQTSPERTETITILGRTEERIVESGYWTTTHFNYFDTNPIYPDEYLWEEMSYCPEPMMSSSTPSMYMTALNMAENFNAEVQDRVYFDLRFFGGAQGFGARKVNDDGIPTADLARATIGLEKTFFRKRCSLELRIPVIMTLNSNLHDERSIGSSQGNQLGNISLVFKHAFRRQRDYTLSRGIGINLPTAPGIRMTYAYSRSNIVEGFIDNDKMSLVPFLGVQWHPRDSSAFAHGVAQLDIAVGQNRLRFYDTTWDGRRDEYRATLHESSLVRLNFGGGRWLIDLNEQNSQFKLGVMAECHYTANIDQLGSKNIFGRLPDNYNYFSATATNRGWQMINLVFGLPVQSNRMAVMPFVTTPITNVRYFDVEGGFTFDVRF